MTFCQGDIVKLDFDPTKGHEQAGFRPAVVLSRKLYNDTTKQIVICPITTKAKALPMRIALDSRTQTTGFIIADQVRTIDVNARNPQFIEKLPQDLLSKVICVVSAYIAEEK